jgi:seryl-tRNA synthetase
VSSFFSTKTTGKDVFHFPEPEFNWQYLCNSNNMEEIRKNIVNRKGVGDIDRVVSLWKSLQSLDPADSRYSEVRQELLTAAADIPNATHPQSPIGDESHAHQAMLCGPKREFNFIPKTAVEIGENLDILRTQHVGHATGPRTYYLRRELAQLEQALVQFTLHNLRTKYNFTMMSVPDLVRQEIIEGCGFKTSGERTQVYRLDRDVHNGNVCLAGTGEFPLAGFFANKCLREEDLPCRLTTASRCYRAETSDVARERGLYRVHQFTKVEMFAVTAAETGSESELMLSDFVNIERDLFEQIGLHFRVLDMPSQELGAPAYRKYDMEAWLPANQFWGEISSTSNCTDFQSRRLGIKYRSRQGTIKHCHTVNGTACAIPRMIIAILENYQQPDGSVVIPDVLRPFMDHKDVITKPLKSLVMKPFRLSTARKQKSSPYPADEDDLNDMVGP